jgi:hypothetical protein
MSNKKKTTQSKQSGSPAAGTDPVTAIQQVASSMPAAAPVTKTALSEMRSASRRAPAKLIALVLSMAEEGGGSVAGVPIDATAARNSLAQATSLRVGAASARAVARQLEQEALTLASGVAQQALSATTSLEAFARTPNGRSLAAKAADLRTAARGTRRPSKAKAAAAPVVTGPAPAPTVTHEPTANGAPAAPATGASTTA